MTRSSDLVMVEREVLSVIDAAEELAIAVIEYNEGKRDKPTGTPLYAKILRLRSALQSVEGGVQGSIATKQATEVTSASVLSEAVLIEAIARALCVEAGDDPSRPSYAREMKCAGSDREPREKWEYWKPFARAAIAAYEDFIPVQGAEPASGAHVAGRTGCANRPTGASDNREQRTGAYLLQTAKSLGWPDDGEGALEFMLRKAREVAFEDCGKPGPSDPLTKTPSADHDDGNLRTTGGEV